jgi:hypothetical protein
MVPSTATGDVMAILFLLCERGHAYCVSVGTLTGKPYMVL